MHELSICQALMTQVENIARENHAQHVTSITLGVGPLAGVEVQLLKNAFPLAAAGSPASDAALRVHTTPVRVRCTTCRKESTARPSRLVCPHCGDWKTELISGDELLLMQVELDKKTPSPNPDSDAGGYAHVR